MKIAPISWNAAREWISEHHRHLPPPQGWLFGVQLVEHEIRVGVGCAGRPVARRLDDGKTLEITRIAVLESQRNACSMLYGALRNAGRALGYERFLTYTLAEEPGTSLRAAGWRLTGTTEGGEWSRPSRKREPGQQTCPKNRWEWP